MVHKIHDTDIVIRMRKTVTRMCDSSATLSVQYAVTRNWIVLPATSGAHLQDDEAQRLASVAKDYGNCALLAASTEADFGYYVEPTQAALMALSWEMAGCYFLMWPPDEAYAVLFVDDYKLYAGARKDVEAALGTSVEIARRAFIEDTFDSSLEAVARRIMEKYSGLIA